MAETIKTFYQENTVEVEVNGKKVRIAKSDKELFDKANKKK